MPDPNGKFPFDEDCEEPYKNQMVFASMIAEQNVGGRTNEK